MNERPRFESAAESMGKDELVPLPNSPDGRAPLNPQSIGFYSVISVCSVVTKKTNYAHLRL